MRAAALTLCLSSAAPTVHAADAILACKLAGRPRGPARATTTTVRCLEVESGLVTAAVRRVGKTKRVRLDADALPTLVSVDATNVQTGAQKSGVSGTLRLEAGRKTKARVRLEDGSADAQVGQRAASVAPQAVPSGGYIGVSRNDITLEGVDGVLRNGLREMLYTDMANMRCYGTRFSAVEVDHIADLLAEIALSNSPAADPSTRLQNRIISPTRMLHGSITSAGGTTTITVSVVDAATGETRGTVTSTGADDRFFEIEADVARRLEALLCDTSGRWVGTASEDAILTSPQGSLTRHAEATVTWSPAPFDPTGTILQPSGSVTISATGTAGPCSISLPATTLAIGPNDGLLQFLGDQYLIFGSGAGGGVFLDYIYSCPEGSTILPGDVKPWLQAPQQPRPDPGQPLQGTHTSEGITYTWRFDPEVQ